MKEIQRQKNAATVLQCTHRIFRAKQDLKKKRHEHVVKVKRVIRAQTKIRVLQAQHKVKTMLLMRKANELLAAKQSRTEEARRVSQDTHLYIFIYIWIHMLLTSFSISLSLSVWEEAFNFYNTPYTYTIIGVCYHRSGDHSAAHVPHVQLLGHRTRLHRTQEKRAQWEDTQLDSTVESHSVVEEVTEEQHWSELKESSSSNYIAIVR